MLKGYDFDDLLLVPKISEVNSREDVDLSVYLDNLKLGIPIIGSPMKGIMNPNLAIKLHELGGIGILHRFYPDTTTWYSDLELMEHANISRGVKFGFATGMNDFKNFAEGLDYGASICCIDVANGYLTDLHKYIKLCKDYIINNNFDCLILSGNVVTSEGAKVLSDNGCDLVRVGIGSGGLCTTRNVTGVGYPQLSAIEGTSTVANYVISDGGIRNSGDIVKALAAGASAVMIGSLLGRTEESSHNGVIYGMASRRLQFEYYQGAKSIEGVEKALTKDTTLKDLIDELAYGIRSACTYLNCRSISKLHLNAEWIKVGKGTLKEL